ncbi:type III PLP-dependent enzyme [Rhizobium sp. BK661]|uniref:type III PLP-dependent enzyme n=1 Tax=Rhizobium sp. BK661 TaxID=2586991 RepID=UPI002169442B|nr:type III PLP-dependent enzyme [Rhizobium sp. BK661]MCS3743517.1 ornithine decarboxylase [Rhizobium sp. BK661]
MNAHALSAEHVLGHDARHLQGQIETAFSGDGRTLRPAKDALRNFASVDAVIAELKPSEPVFCITPERLRSAAASFSSFPGTCLYAVKCNPHPFVLETLYQTGITNFDVASLDEVELIGSLFGSTAGKFYNNPAKTRRSIRMANDLHGIRFYTADCLEEVDKIAEEARGSDLVIAVRLATNGTDARYVLSTKFGATPDKAIHLLRHIRSKGIKAGISFHVGSQCLAPGAFSEAVELAGDVAKRAGVELAVLNVGGGFPAPYPGDDVVGPGHYFKSVARALRNGAIPRSCSILCEPGRALVATAGITLVQVVMRRDHNLFLNDGVFGTLQELGHSKERRPVRLIPSTPRVSATYTDFKVWGPTCDSNDVLGAPFSLPDDVREGDWIEVGMMGAYSLSMRTHFNGFFADKIVTIGA